MSARWQAFDAPITKIGADSDAPKKGGFGTVAIVVGIGVAIVAFSPGMRHFYKHGKLPA